jgi:hypothetical protein
VSNYGILLLNGLSRHSVEPMSVSKCSRIYNTCAASGKPLGITGEIGEYEAARCLGLTLADARTAGYDATDRRGRRIQIKSRSIPRSRKHTGQKLGEIKLKHQWGKRERTCEGHQMLSFDVQNSKELCTSTHSCGFA